MQYIALDAHKKYTLASVEHAAGGILREVRVTHTRGAIQQFLAQFEPRSPVALEAASNWYLIVDEIEAAGMTPRLVHPRKAKLMMGLIDKTDRLDVRGLNCLQRTGRFPGALHRCHSPPPEPPPGLQPRHEGCNSTVRSTRPLAVESQCVLAFALLRPE